MFDLSLMGRLSFAPTFPSVEPEFKPGRNLLGVSEERDYVLYVPESLDAGQPVPLLVFFHGAGGSPEKILPFIEAHAEERGMLVLAPHSMLPTWDIVIGGNGPDLERLDTALAKLASHYLLDPHQFGFAGFSDGGSYALSNGLTNGHFVSHIMVFSGGFMTAMMPEGMPQVFISHGLVDEQLPIETSGRANAEKLKESGYPVHYVEFNGKHIIHPPIVKLAVDFFYGETA